MSIFPVFIAAAPVFNNLSRSDAKKTAKAILRHTVNGTASTSALAKTALETLIEVCATTSPLHLVEITKLLCDESSGSRTNVNRDLQLVCASFIEKSLLQILELRRCAEETSDLKAILVSVEKMLTGASMKQLVSLAVLSNKNAGIRKHAEKALLNLQNLVGEGAFTKSIIGKITGIASHQEQEITRKINKLSKAKKAASSRRGTTIADAAARRGTKFESLAEKTLSSEEAAVIENAAPLGEHADIYDIGDLSAVAPEMSPEYASFPFVNKDPRDRRSVSELVPESTIPAKRIDPVIDEEGVVRKTAVRRKKSILRGLFSAVQYVCFPLTIAYLVYSSSSLLVIFSKQDALE